MTRGLVLGKFAPFHRGHELLIKRSIERCDETVVLVYDSPEVTRIPLETRCGWITMLYPEAVVIAGHDSPSEAGKSLEIMRKQEKYIQSVVPLPITHFFCSEWYGAHVSASLNAMDVRVDEARLAVPVSGTQIRSNPYEYRRYLSSVVYHDLYRRVVLLGAESTGKSTLAEALAKSFETVHVPEHGRDFWMKHKDEDGLLSPLQLLQLAREHRELEDSISLNANRIVFIDTDARTTRLYSKWYHKGVVLPELSSLADECETRYHLTVLSGDDIPYVDDGTRAGELRRRTAQAEIRDELAASGCDWIEAVGSVEERVTCITNAMTERMLLDWH